MTLLTLIGLRGIFLAHSRGIVWFSGCTLVTFALGEGEMTADNLNLPCFIGKPFIYRLSLLRQTKLTVILIIEIFPNLLVIVIVIISCPVLGF